MSSLLSSPGLAIAGQSGGRGPVLIGPNGPEMPGPAQSPAPSSPQRLTNTEKKSGHGCIMTPCGTTPLWPSVRSP